MRELIVVAVSLLIVWGLTVLVREPGPRASKALWLPLIWCFINGSRQLSEWYNVPYDDPNRFSEGTPLDAGFYGVLILVGLLILNRRPRQMKVFLQENWHILLFYAYCAISITWSDYPYIALKRWVKLVGDLVMILILFTDPSPMLMIRRLFSRLAFILVTFSLTFILLVPEIGTARDSYTGVVYYNGISMQKNMLGEACLIAGLGTLWLLLTAFEAPKSALRNRQMITYAIMTLLSLWLIKKADSMTSFTALVLAGGVMVLVSQRWLVSSVSRVHLLMGSTIALAASTILLDAAGPLLSLLGRTSSFTGRTAIWYAVLAAHTNPLIGTGYESFWLGERIQFVWDVSGQHIQQAHNGYLEIYINLGWIGVLCLAALLMYGYRNAVKTFSHDPLFGRLVLGFFTAALIHNFSEAGFRMMNLVWFALLFAITGGWDVRRTAVDAAPAAAPVLGSMRVLT